MKVPSLKKYPMNHSFMPSRLQVETEKEERNCLLGLYLPSLVVSH
jgi:hypothetical protein